MKSNRKHSILSNGVSISHCDKSIIENANKSKVSFLNDIILLLLQILAGISSIMTLSTILNFNIDSLYVYITVILFAVVYTVAFKIIKSKRWVVFVSALTLTATIFLILFGSVIDGFIYLYDQGYETICKYMYFDLPFLPYEWTDDLKYNTNLAICLLTALYMCFISYFTVVKINFVVMFLLTFPCFEIGAAFGCVPNYYYFAAMVATWAAYVSLHQANNVKTKKVSSNISSGAETV